MSVRRAQDERLEGLPDGVSAITEISDVADAPTIGTATAGIQSASVTFTAAVTGGSATTYRATSSPGSITGSASSSPISVTGLTAGTAYTFTVQGGVVQGATTIYGAASAASNSVTPTAPVEEFVAVARIFGYGASSTDGITWTERTIPNIANWSRWVDGAYSTSVGRYVAVAYEYPDTSKAAMYSTDGISWTNTTMPYTTAAGWRACAFGNGVYVAMGYGVGVSNVATSTDGITWTGRTVPTAKSFFSLVYGDKFVAAARNGSPTTSTDGITWSNRTGAITEDWFGIGYGAAAPTYKYIMVAPNTTRTQYSTDGITWSQGGNLPNISAYNGWNSVTYGDKWIALSGGPTTTAATSTDGVTWTVRTMPANLNWRKVEYHTNKYVAIAYSSPNQAASSTDAITWTVRSMPRSADWYTLIPRTNG